MIKKRFRFEIDFFGLFLFCVIIIIIIIIIIILNTQLKKITKQKISYKSHNKTLFSFIIHKCIFSFYKQKEKKDCNQFVVIHNNWANRISLCAGDGSFKFLTYQLDGTVVAYHGFYGWRRIRVRFRRGSLRDGYHF